MTATKAPARRAAAPRKAAKPKVINGNGAPADDDAVYEPTIEIRSPQEYKVVEEPKAAEHPLYGSKKVYVYHPKDGSDPIEFPHISNCRPTALFFYDNRHKDEMNQAFAWMDLCGVPDQIGRRLFLLPDEEQGALLREWFGGLNLTPKPGVAPPGES